MLTFLFFLFVLLLSDSSFMRISFPSAKDPSLVEENPDLTTCIIETEATDEFVEKKEFNIGDGKYIRIKDMSMFP